MIPKIGAEVGPETRNIINQVIDFINGKSTEIISSDAIKNILERWVADNNFKPLAPVQTKGDLPTDAKNGDIRGVIEENAIYSFNGTEWNKLSNIDFSQMTEVEKKVDELRYYTLTKSNLLNDGQKEKKALVSFIADDAPTNDLTKLIPIVNEKKFPVALATITKHVGTSNFQNIPLLSWSKLHELRATGLVEVIGHTHEHRNSTQLSPEVLEEDIRNCKMTLLENGIDTDCIVYPYNAYNETTKAIVKKYFKYSFGRYNPPQIMSNTPIDNNAIHRVSLGSYYDIASNQFTEQDTSSLAYYKEQVDKAIERKDWLVFVLHTHTTNFPEEQQQHLRDVVDYIRSKGVDIVFPSKGAEIFANTLQIDSADGSRTTINAAGQADGAYFGTRTDGVNGHKSTDDITAFEKGKVTYTPINATEARTGAYPNTNGGMLTTYRVTDSIAHIKQTYEPIIFDTSKGIATKLFYERTYFNGWQEWVQREMPASVTVDVINGHKAADTIDKFEKGKVTYTPINTSEASTGGYPSFNGGILTTYYLEEGTAYVRQTYEPTMIFGGTSVDSPVYRRYWLNNTWTSWVADRFKAAKTVPIVGLTAGQTWETPLAIAGISDRHTVNVTVDNATPLPDGVIMDVINVANDSIKIRLANVKATSSSSTSVKFIVSATL